jgi:hypothetical protein
MKNLLSNLFVLLATTLVMLGLSEVVIRQFVDPLDYLLPVTMADSELGHRIAPNTGGHDPWGFRNNAVPAKAKIVLLGDSMIYGTASTYESSIPSLLHKELGVEVYGMALGGYGAPHYSMLLDRALSLSPDTVVVGLSFGNNFMHAFNFVYDPDHTKFASMRQARFTGADTFKPVAIDVIPKFGVKAARDWLAGHSVLYRALTTRLLNLNAFRVREQQKSGDTILSIVDKNGAVVTGIPLRAASNVDPGDPRIQEGVRISLALIEEMKKKCETRGVKFAILLLPTRFSTFRSELTSQPQYPPGARKAVEDEVAMFETLHAALRRMGVWTIDVRKPLEEAAKQQERIYPINDGHLTAVGNGVVASYMAGELAGAMGR